MKLGYILVPAIALTFALAIGYFMNIYKLTQLDFKEPYKAEVIRTIGIIPIVGCFSGWVDIGEENNTSK